MRTNKVFNIYSLLLIIMLFVGFSCSDTGTGSENDNPQTENPNDDQDGGDDQQEDEETTVEEDIEHINLSIDNMISALGDFGDGDFSTALETFINANAGDVDAEWANNMFSKLDSYINIQSIEENHRFDFAGHTGIYTWNSGSQTWSKTAASGQIVLQFPTSGSSTTNDLTLTLSEYEDVAVVIEGGGYYLPNHLKTEIELDGKEIFGFTLNDIKYSDDELPLPRTLDLEIFTAPFTHRFTLSRNSDTEFEFGWNIDNDGDLVTGLDLNLTLAHNDYSNLDEDDLEMLSGTFNLTEDLVIDFSGEIGTLITIEDPSENQVNSLVSAEVLYKGKKIGDLEYSEEAENVIIIYKDGSSETIDRYYEHFAEEVELIFYTFTGDWAEF